MKPRKPLIRSRMKRQSPRGKLIKQCDDLLFHILLLERGSVCEICGKPGNMTPFHILPKGSYPRIRFYKANLLLACWFSCHNLWHHDYFIAKERIEPRIKQLRDEDYKDKLIASNAMAPRLSTTYLGILREALKIKLKQLEDTK